MTSTARQKMPSNIILDDLMSGLKNRVRQYPVSSTPKQVSSTLHRSEESAGRSQIKQLQIQKWLVRMREYELLLTTRLEDLQHLKLTAAELEYARHHPLTAQEEDILLLWRSDVDRYHSTVETVLDEVRGAYAEVSAINNGQELFPSRPSQWQALEDRMDRFASAIDGLSSPPSIPSLLLAHNHIHTRHDDDDAQPSEMLTEMRIDQSTQCPEHNTETKHVCDAENISRWLKSVTAHLYSHLSSQVVRTTTDGSAMNYLRAEMNRVEADPRSLEQWLQENPCAEAEAFRGALTQFIRESTSRENVHKDWCTKMLRGMKQSHTKEVQNLITAHSKDIEAARIDERRKVREELETFDKERSQMEYRLSWMQQEMETVAKPLREEVQHLRSQLDRGKRILAEQESRFNSELESRQSRIQNLTAAYEIQIAELKNENSKLDNERGKQNKTISQLNDELDQHKKKIEQDQLLLVELKQMTNRLVEGLSDKFDQKVTHLTSRIKELETELTQQKASNQLSVQGLQSQLQEAIKAKRESESQLDSTKAELQQTQAVFTERLNQMSDQCESRVNDAQEEIDKLCKAHAAFLATHVVDPVQSANAKLLPAMHQHIPVDSHPDSVQALKQEIEDQRKQIREFKKEKKAWLASLKSTPDSVLNQQAVVCGRKDGKPVHASIQTDPRDELPVWDSRVCVRCGCNDLNRPSKCMFHPFLAEGGGPFMYGPQWHACREARHDNSCPPCYERYEHSYGTHRPWVPARRNHAKATVAKPDLKLISKRDSSSESHRLDSIPRITRSARPLGEAIRLVTDETISTLTRPLNNGQEFSSHSFKEHIQYSMQLDQYLSQPRVD